MTRQTTQSGRPKWKRTAARVALFTAALGIIVGVAVAVDMTHAQPDNGATDANDGVSADELELSDLNQNGPTVGDSPESVRLATSEMWWMVSWPPGGIGTEPGDATDPNFDYVGADDVIERDTVWLRTVNIGDPREQTVTVATYDVAYRSVPGPNGTETGEQEPYATNVTVQQQTVNVGQGWVIEPVDLPHTTEEQNVAVWLGDNPDTDLRWTFSHETTTTAQSVPFSTWGGLFSWIAPVFVLPLVVGSVGALGGAKRVVRRTGTGPGFSTLQWSFLFGLGALIMGWAYYGELAAFAVDYPFAIAAFFVAYIFAVAVDRFNAYTTVARFIQPKLHTVSSPSGSRAADQLGANERTLQIIDRPDEPAAVATPGLIPFLARLVSGKAAVLKTVDPGHESADERGDTTTDQDPLQCRIPVEQGSVDEKIITHPKMPEPINYTPERFEIDVPEIKTLGDLTPLLVRVGAVVALAVAVAQWFGPGLATVVGATGVALTLVSAKAGEAEVWLSPVHYRSARSTALHLAAELDDADTINEEREKRIQQAIQTEKRVMEEADNRDSTLMESLYSFATDSDEEDSPQTVPLDDLGRPEDYDDGRNGGVGGDDD